MVERFRLGNGLPIFVVESHASPAASVQFWVRRGSAHEPDTLAGVSHFLEHAVFKGTPSRGVGEIAREIESRGGEINAFTSFEETAFHVTVASRYLRDGLAVIADTVRNPLFDPSEMAREREVILEEIRRAHDSPMKMLGMNTWSTAYKGSSYGRPVLGFERTVSRIDHAMLRRYFEGNYHAGNGALFVVGDVDPAEVLEMARKALSGLRSGKQGRDAPEPPAARAVRPANIEREIADCYLQFGYRGPGIGAPEIPALDLACAALGQGESSRLYQRLVKETRLALDVQLGVAATRRCGLVTVTVSTSPEKLEEAVRECRATIEEGLSAGLGEREIERVKSSLEAEVVRGRETVEGHARRLGYYHAHFGDPDYEPRYLSQITAVTAAQATATLSRCLRSRPTISVVRPKGSVVDEKRLQNALSPGPRSRSRVASSDVPGSTTRLVRERVVHLVKEVDSLPLLSVRLVFPGGTRAEPEGQEGIAQLFQRTWASGTRSFSALKIAQTLEALGASLYAFSGRNTFGLSVDVLSKHWDRIEPILADILSAPAFPEHEVELERELMLRDLASERDSPGQICQLNLAEALYASHFYGRSALGTPSSVGRLDAGALRRHFQTRVARDGLVVSSVGPVKPEGWVSLVGGLLAALPENGVSLPAAPAIPMPDGVQVRTATKQPLHQSHVLVGFLGPGLHSDDRYALKLLASCLAGQGGRLFLQLRDRESLAYTVAPIAADAPDRGQFAFYIACAPEKLTRAISGIRRELDRVLDTPLKRDELDRAKRFWLGRFELDLQRFGAQAVTAALDEAYGLGHDHSERIGATIRDVTARQVQEAARTYLGPDRLAISVVHPEKIDAQEIRGAWALA